MPRRPATRRQLRLVPSVPAKPEPAFGVEPFFLCAKELRPLFKRHWRELGRDREAVPLDPWWEQFAGMDRAGILRILVARMPSDSDEAGELVGYVFNIVGPHLHYKTTMHANVDMYWLDPRFRSGWTGVKMLRANEKYLRELGVKRLMISENLMFKNKHGRRARVLFKRLGYKPVDVHYRKMLTE